MSVIAVLNRHENGISKGSLAGELGRVKGKREAEGNKVHAENTTTEDTENTEMQVGKSE
jgi:hypothetical protein